MIYHLAPFHSRIGFNHRGQGTARKQPTFRMQLLSERGISKAHCRTFRVDGRGKGRQRMGKLVWRTFQRFTKPDKPAVCITKIGVYLFFENYLVVSKFFYPWDEMFFIMVSLTTMVSEFRTMFFVPHFFNKSFHLFNNYLKKSKRNSKKRIELLVLERYDNDHWTQRTVRTYAFRMCLDTLKPIILWRYDWMSRIGYPPKKGFTHVQGGPLPVLINEAITPPNRCYFTPITHLFSAIYRGYNTMFNKCFMNKNSSICINAL